MKPDAVPNAAQSPTAASAEPANDDSSSVEAVFCPRLWDEVELISSGGMRPCCLFDGVVKDKGYTASVYSTTIEQYAGASDLVLARREMLAGKRVAACKKCYRAEDATGQSIRKSTIGNRGGVELALEGVLAAAQTPEVRKLMIEFGDRCSLRCRMCRPYHSTSIAADVTQISLLYPNREVDRDYAGLSALPKKLRWYEDKEFCTTTLVEMCASVDDLKIVGGEPFINANFIHFLKALAASGRAEQMSICVTTSGSIAGDSWWRALQPFKQRTINLSLDGVGDLNGYIRAGADWTLINEFIQKARREAIPVQVLTTVQAYNLLRLSELSAFCSDQGLGWYPSWLFDPIFLDPASFPAAKRRVFLSSVQTQLFEAGSQKERDRLSSYHDRLAGAVVTDETNWLRFVQYTLSLDRDRKQNLADAVPELFATF